MRLRGGAETVNEPSMGAWPAASSMDAIPCLSLKGAAVIGIEPLAVRIVGAALGVRSGGRKRSGARRRFFPLCRRGSGLLVFGMALAHAEQSGEPHKRSLRKVAAPLRRWLSLLRKDLNQGATLCACLLARFVRWLTLKNN